MLCDLNAKFKCYGKHKGEKYRNFILQGIYTGQKDKVWGGVNLCVATAVCGQTQWQRAGGENKQTNKERESCLESYSSGMISSRICWREARGGVN